ncbi:MAG: NADP-specific glutamate dehydrogenase [Erysipelotrichaceae bacterium]|jgi:glutamate dehydrogenase (NADP+)|nr:NADP-specific glutamate dehydrogenase [Bacillota bacterium]NLP21939.1 NADP-specific glutamate dehydrogenase [Erysipelotrichaceae bacterium]
MSYIDRVIEEYKVKDADQPEFIQAVEEVINSVSVIFDKHPEYENMAILERLLEPERIIKFKVPWVDDNGKINVNRGYRIQYNSALGPYKGGIRFHPSVSESILKFLGFEQTFKNALTNLPMGGGKGGSDFNPMGKSDMEIMRFCQSFMTELYRHIGENVDVPAGDMGVGAREVGYFYGQYRRLTGTSERGVITGKGVGYGGSLIRTEATGYGIMYLTMEVLNKFNIDPKGKRIIVSGCGVVGTFAAKKAAELGMKIVGISDITGYVLDEDGFDVTFLDDMRSIKGKTLGDYVKDRGKGKFYENASIYDHDVSVDMVFPCATQNEINLERAKRLVKNGAYVMVEGANMPNTNEALSYFIEKDLIVVPGKAANAGGVATSGLEMTQNSIRLYWSKEKVDEKLQGIMKDIHNQCIATMKEYNLDEKNYVSAANIAGVQRVIDAMIAQGDY